MQAAQSSSDDDVEVTGENKPDDPDAGLDAYAGLPQLIPMLLEEASRHGREKLSMKDLHKEVVMWNSCVTGKYTLADVEKACESLVSANEVLVSSEYVFKI